MSQYMLCVPAHAACPCMLGTSVKASAERLKDRIVVAAKEGWSKVRLRLQGRRLKRECDAFVVEDKRVEKEEGGKSVEDMMAE
jgi:hypothetical protein